jgi:hypothetical protein
MVHQVHQTAPRITTICVMCHCTMHNVGNNRKYCDDCTPKRKQQYDLIYGRIKRGRLPQSAMPVDDTTTWLLVSDPDEEAAMVTGCELDNENVKHMLKYGTFTPDTILKHKTNGLHKVVGDSKHQVLQPILNCIA